jgi:hypothetical protein
MTTEKDIHDRAVTIRVTQAQYDTIAALATENRQTISSMVGGFVDSCVEIINENNTPTMPQFLAVCRLAKHYQKKPKEKIK